MIDGSQVRGRAGGRDLGSLMCVQVANEATGMDELQGCAVRENR